MFILNFIILFLFLMFLFRFFFFFINLLFYNFQVKNEKNLLKFNTKNTNNIIIYFIFKHYNWHFLDILTFSNWKIIFSCYSILNCHMECPSIYFSQYILLININFYSKNQILVNNGNQYFIFFLKIFTIIFHFDFVLVFQFCLSCITNFQWLIFLFLFIFLKFLYNLFKNKMKTFQSIIFLIFQ